MRAAKRARRSGQISGGVISVDSYSIWNATLTAFDIDGNVISSVDLVNPNAGSSFLRGQLSLTSTLC